ncbi:hypothetical protein EC957_003800 [Mortierella hygrophila]|uniref:Uncharacterized protein n=1 Tax=Mortierella hygrophila TaxID=979708 RepID=A0A9P6K7D4_9FUNG|nr:hypothetical protein EC957_003800 [Mortierella hygrophila]
MALETSIIFPTNKHNRPTPPSKIHLHGLDGLSAAIQIHNHRFFRRPSVPLRDVVEQLKVSLAEALELYPPVAGTVLSNDKGEIFIATDKDGIVGTPFLVDLKDTPFVKDEENLSPRTDVILPPMASTLAVKVTQFSCGTICVASSFNHQVADLRGFLDFLELWAQLSRGEPADFTRIPDDWERTPGRFFTDLIKQFEEVSLPAPAPFVLLDTPATGPSAYLLAPSVATNWKISKSSMVQLKHDLSPPAGSGLWISSGDALAALVSGAVTRARQDNKVARLEGRSSEESEVESIAMAADGRERAPKGDMSGGRYLGNFNNLWGLTIPRSDLSTPTAEATGRVALAIRSNLEVHLSAESVAKRVAFFDNPAVCNPPGRVGWVADIVLTNWCRFDLKGPKLRFGWGEKPFMATSGGGTVFPPAYSLMTEDKETGDVFVLLTVENDGESALVGDVLLNKYATLVSS